MLNEVYMCGECGEVFDGQGTVHGQPAALWAWLEHRESRREVPVPPLLTMLGKRIGASLTVNCRGAVELDQEQIDALAALYPTVPEVSEWETICGLPIQRVGSAIRRTNHLNRTHEGENQ